MYSADDDLHMARALRLAEHGLYTTTPNPRVGCVIVRDQTVLGEGFTQPAGKNHAEIEALAHARRLGHDVRGATVYVTLEPCSHFGRTPPCANALIDAGVSQVVVAMQDPNPQVSGRGLHLLRDAGIEVRCGLRAKEAFELNLGFVSRMIRSRPWVRMKLAASLDASSALPNGTSQWITGEAARADGHRWRARACAVLTGIGTVRMDDPQMTVRHIETPRQPMRIVVDSRLDISPSARILQRTPDDSPVLIACAVDEPAKRAALQAQGAEVVMLANARGKVDLAALMEALGHRGINELHVEAGNRLNGSLISAGCIDELLLYMAPRLLGQGQPMIELAPPAGLDGGESLKFLGHELIGQDLRLLARFQPSFADRSM